MPSKGWHKRQRVWRHNGLRGSAKLMMTNCRSIIDSPTTTQESKRWATEIEQLAELLFDSLKERVDD